MEYGRHTHRNLARSLIGQTAIHLREDDAADDIELGAGPVIARGSANHPQLVDHARRVADTEGIDVQLQAAGSATGTDTDAFYTARSGVPSLSVSLPNRYMHTPVELVDTDDLGAIAELLGAMSAEIDNIQSFVVN